jgi:hypothetical protein
MFNTIVGARAAGAASRYGSGSDQKMRLRNTAINGVQVIGNAYLIVYRSFTLFEEKIKITVNH